MTRMERMLEAMNLDAAREIIGEFQDELNSLEVSHNLNPNVGDVTPPSFRWVLGHQAEGVGKIY